MRLSKPLLLSQVVLWAVSAGVGGEPTLEEIRVAPEGRGFVLFPSGARFVPWGFNYDHDERSRLLEDYWEMEWPKVAEDFREMKALGANAVRIHLQLGKFLKGANEPNPEALQRLEKLIALAEGTGLYLNLTGLGCYRKQDVPGWYQALEESERWGVQVRFWEEVAARCVGSRAIFCYDLMNEPVVAGGKRSAGDWLGPPFGEFHFVQFITLDPRGRRPEIARAWINTLARAIRRVDPRGLVTVGLVDWSLDRPGLTSGFVPAAVAPELDFLSVHIYPESGKLDEAVVTLEAFAAVGKPVVIEETFPLKCGVAEFRRFLDRSRPHAAGWFGFYWGKSPEELRRSGTIADHMMLGSLELFRELAPSIAKAGLDPSD
jgi:hypothetical protein